MSTPIQNNTVELEKVLEQVYNLPDRGTGGGSGGIDCLVKSDIASAEEILEFVMEQSFVTPAGNGDNIIYVDNNNMVYII